ncbi:MAG: arylesterase [Longimicrobiales bacterium]
MRRIIAVFSTAALFACSAQPNAADNTPSTADATAAVRDSAGGRTNAVARNIVFLGTSLTAGYGVGPDVAFPAVIQHFIDSVGVPYRVTNAGISGETSAGGLRRIDWLLQTPVDVLVLELGANDGLRGLNTDSLQSNLDAILQRTRTKYPDAAIVIAGMEAPPNLGVAYTTRFRRVYRTLADRYHATLIPFFLNGVAGMARLNQEDGIHPNAEGHRMVADSMWTVLGPLLTARFLP